MTMMSGNTALTCHMGLIRHQRQFLFVIGQEVNTLVLVLCLKSYFYTRY